MNHTRPNNGVVERGYYLLLVPGSRRKPRLLRSLVLSVVFLQPVDAEIRGRAVRVVHAAGQLVATREYDTPEAAEFARARLALLIRKADVEVLSDEWVVQQVEMLPEFSD